MHVCERVLVLDWTQCPPQGVGAPTAMLRGRTAGFHKNTGFPGRRDRWVQFAQSVVHQPCACCIRLVPDI